MALVNLQSALKHTFVRTSAGEQAPFRKNEGAQGRKSHRRIDFISINELMNHKYDQFSFQMFKNRIESITRTAWVITFILACLSIISMGLGCFLLIGWLMIMNIFIRKQALLHFFSPFCSYCNKPMEWYNNNDVEATTLGCNKASLYVCNSCLTYFKYDYHFESGSSGGGGGGG